MRDGHFPEKASFISLGVHKAMVSVRVISTQRDPHFSKMHASMSRKCDNRIKESILDIIMYLES